jgi:DNA-binding CsgD family transcriptional regulator
MSLAHDSGEPSADLRSLVYRIHRATEDEAGWSDVLELLRVRLRARSASLGVHDFASGTGQTLFGVPSDDGLADDSARFAVRNPWFLSSLEYVPGRVMFGEELIGHRELKRTDFYRCVLRPHGLMHRLCGVATRQGEVAYFVAVLRGEEQEPFAAREAATLKALLAHVSLSLSNRWRYREADDLAKAMMRVVDHAAHATILVTRDGEIVYRSLGAEKLEGSGTGLVIRDKILLASAPGDARALREAIEAVTRADATLGDAAACRVLAVRAQASPRPTIVTVRPGGEVFLAPHGKLLRLAALTVKGAHAEHDAQTCAFARQFELTPAQAKVSALVFAGHSLSSVAHTLCVSDNTVRSHLKQVYQKTNTHAQMELVHLHAQVCTDQG